MSNSLDISRLLATLVLVVIASSASLTLTSFAQDSKAPQNVGPAFSLSIVPVETTFKAGSRVLVDVTLKNVADHPLDIELRLGDEGIEYPLHVWDEKEKAAPETRYGRLKNNHLSPDDPPMEDAFKGVDVTVDLAKSITNRVNVSYVHDLSKPGKYTIQVECYDSESKTYVKSNKIEVTVTP